jgi:2-methylcitrate dehydratase
VFCLFERPPERGASPFDLELATGGEDFAVMGMHFKLGLYEHQSAGAIAGLFHLLEQQPRLLDDVSQIEKIAITIYEPAFSIIGDPHKRDPRTRQSADHSMVYIVATLLKKAFAARQSTGARRQERPDDWAELMLVPEDYSEAALLHPVTRDLMRRIEFRHGGADYDAKYPDGIPTTLEILHTSLGRLSSGLVMYPEGHARNSSGNLAPLLETKFRRLAGMGVHDVNGLIQRMSGLADKSAAEIRDLYSFEIDHVRPA